MYRLTDFDKFHIEELFSKINLQSKIDKNFNFDTFYSTSNKDIAKTINRALDLWYTTVTSGYKGFSPTESQLYSNSHAIIKKLLTENTPNVSTQDIYFPEITIHELEKIKTNDFDLTKLTSILKEVNICYLNSAYLGVSSLLRMLLDHIPPIFGKSTFIEVVNNYPFSKSDKKNLEHLLGALKHISDSNLHNTISKKEILPNSTSIEFRADFQVLLKNIILALNK